MARGGSEPILAMRANTALTLTWPACVSYLSIKERLVIRMGVSPCFLAA
jgi:hypothetical protein